MARRIPYAQDPNDRKHSFCMLKILVELANLRPVQLWVHPLGLYGAFVSKVVAPSVLPLDALELLKFWWAFTFVQAVTRPCAKVFVSLSLRMPAYILLALICWQKGRLQVRITFKLSPT